MLITTLYLLGKFTLPHDTPSTGSALSAGRTFASMVTLGTGIWLATGLTGRPLGTLESFLPPPVEGTVANASSSPSSVELVWTKDNLPAVLTTAKQSNKRVFIDYTGYTCTNCRWMESNIFTRPEIKAELNKFALARLYTDDGGDLDNQQQAQQQHQFGTVALPLYAIVDADGKTIATSPGLTRDPKEFLAFFQKAQSN
jgi:thiol:disulfide interchange protein